MKFSEKLSLKVAKLWNPATPLVLTYNNNALQWKYKICCGDEAAILELHDD